MYREEQPGASFMLGIMTGALIGAGVALLFAPKSGYRDATAARRAVSRARRPGRRVHAALARERAAASRPGSRACAAAHGTACPTGRQRRPIARRLPRSGSPSSAPSV